MLLQAFYSIRSERQLMNWLEFDLLFRWFVGIGVDDAAWDHSTFSTPDGPKNDVTLLPARIGGVPLASASCIAAASRRSLSLATWKSRL